MAELTTLETTLEVPLHGYPENDDTDIGLIENDLETIKSKLATYKGSEGTIDKLYNAIDTYAAEVALDKLDEIIKALATANECQKLTDANEFYKHIREAFEDLQYDVSIEEAIYITLTLEVPSFIVGLSEDKLEELLTK